MPDDDFTAIAQRTIFTAAPYHGRWWIDRVNPHGPTIAVLGPYDELAALREANTLNRINQGWEAHGE